MRRNSEEQPDETDEHFDVDEYAVPDSEEIEVADRGTWFEDGDLYVEEEESEEELEGEVEDFEEPAVAEVFDESPGDEGPEAPGTEPVGPADTTEPATAPASPSARPAKPPAHPASPQARPTSPPARQSKPPARPAKPPTKPKEPREPIGPKVKAVWAALLVEARKIELPGAPDTKRKRIGTVAAIVLASIVVGAGTYLLGRGSGTDVEQAKLEGVAAGRQAGAVEGAARGYATGFRKGQQRGFRKAYVPAYRLYYKRAFEQAGLDVPTNEEIRIPLP